MLSAGAAGAQEVIATQANLPAAAADEVVVVGSRVQARLATQSPAPVDVISGETLRSQGFTDVNRALQFLAPSFNYPRAATGPSAASTRAATLRGLAPDQLLVLVNGKRWHSSAVITFNNEVGRGSTPTDLGAIPMSAVARIEILRDGAAAQYGSDGIAGVINIVLKSSASEGLSGIQTGLTDKGDGQNTTAFLNKGFKLGDAGFLNLTGEVRYRNSSNRAGIDSRFGRVTNQQGDPDTLDFNFAANGAYAVAGGVEVYGDAVYDRRKGISPAQYRAPTISPSLYPNGFIPHVRLDLDEAGGTIGLRRAFGPWAFDLSDSPGYSKAEFAVNSSVNTSLGTTGPTSFYAGGAEYFQNVVDASLARAFPILTGANLALGLSDRYESYKIRGGEPASFSGAGAQGFPGFNPPQPVNASRNSIAVFVDGELKPVAALTLGAAVRYEHYDDFGSATSGKLSLFYKPLDWLAVRATASTGFRAPSLQQTFFSTVTSQSSGGVLVNVGTFAVGDPSAKALGATPLKAETSRNLSAGLVLTPLPDLTVTVDAYLIEIDDRIALSETLSGAAVTAVLNRAGVTNASQVRFFTNAADTETNGYELSANWRHKLGAAKLDLTAGYALVDTDVTSLKPNPVLPTLPLLATSSIDFLTKAQPQNKFTLSARLVWECWTLDANLVRNGPFRAVQVAGEQTYNPVTTLDLVADYAFTPRLKLGVGVLNVGDAYPDKIADRALTQGGSLLYPEVGAVGTNGREYFVRISGRF